MLSEEYKKFCSILELLNWINWIIVLVTSGEKRLPDSWYWWDMLWLLVTRVSHQHCFTGGLHTHHHLASKQFLILLSDIAVEASARQQNTIFYVPDAYFASEEVWDEAIMFSFNVSMLLNNMNIVEAGGEERRSISGFTQITTTHTSPCPALQVSSDLTR